MCASSQHKTFDAEGHVDNLTKEHKCGLNSCKECGIAKSLHSSFDVNGCIKNNHLHSGRHCENIISQGYFQAISFIIIPSRDGLISDWKIALLKKINLDFKVEFEFSQSVNDKNWLLWQRFIRLFHPESKIIMWMILFYYLMDYAKSIQPPSSETNSFNPFLS
jgi:hypothetical protein